MSRPLFIAGTARGGTNLAIMIASVHPEVSLSQDPYLALYKSLRNAAVAAQGPSGFDLESPLDEYYYFAERVRIMKLVQQADLDLPFDARELPALKTVLADRMRLSSPRLLPHLDRLHGRTYRELFECGLDIIARGRGTPGVTWLGFNDNWAAEFFAPLARAFPEARFLIVIRDVRAAVSSHIRMLQAKPKNPLYMYEKSAAMIALQLSFIRCWRKQVAFARHYQQLPELRDRLMVMTYEDLVRAPEQETRRLCGFLDIDYRPGMIDTRNFVSPDGGPWLPNSNQDNVPDHGIFSDTIDRWKESLSPNAIRLAELVAGPDLEWAGYSVSDGSAVSELAKGAYACHALDHESCQGWRTDNRNPEIDIAFELLRRACLTGAAPDPALIEKCFLFPAMYEALRAGERLRAAAPDHSR